MMGFGRAGKDSGPEGRTRAWLRIVCPALWGRSTVQAREVLMHPATRAEFERLFHDVLRAPTTNGALIRNSRAQ